MQRFELLQRKALYKYLLLLIGKKTTPRGTMLLRIACVEVTGRGNQTQGVSHPFYYESLHGSNAVLHLFLYDSLPCSDAI